MSTQQKRLYNKGWDHLKKRSGKRNVTLDINGPGLVLVPKGPTGSPMPANGWTIMVTLENEMLVEHPVHCVSVPVEAHVPSDEMLLGLIDMAWDKCVELDAEANNPPEPAGEEAIEAFRRSDMVGNHVGQRKPAGPRTNAVKRQREHISHFPSKKGTGFGPNTPESDE